ncbi:ATP-dependent DNA ligase Cdc17 [Diatrype stigma]|uniref:DNA ligase n=1 Tax=Diatrype stigma TaxID=117547 RepID=A0AAN9UJN6_9PEZI
MPPKQATLGKFFGKPNGTKPAPTQQTKLSFATRAAKKPKDEPEDSAEEVESSAAEIKIKAEEETKETGARSPDSKKRSRTGQSSKGKTKETPKKVKQESEEEPEEGLEEEAPISKRPRRTRRRVEEDEDEDEVMSEEPVKPKKDTKGKTKPARDPSASPAAKGKKSPKKQNADDEVKSESAASSASEAEDSADDKPGKREVAAKARAKIQTKLKTKAKDPYPDWKAGTPVPYAALCTTFSLIELTTKRLEITEHCALFLRQVLRLTPEDFLPTVLLMINKLAPDYAGIELGIGESLIMKAIGETTGRSLAVIKADQKEIGDLGLVAVKSRSTQPTMFKPKPLTVKGVHKGLMDVATVSGNGAQGRKVDLIKKLLSSADAHSAGKVDIHKDKVEDPLLTALSELPSWDVIIPTMVEHGIMNLRDKCKLRPGVPLKPMLAKPTKAITEVLDRFENQKFTCEYKYDGERAQIHYVAKDHSNEYIDALPGATKEAADGVACIFSRNSEDLSKKYPDVLEKLHTWVKKGTKSFVLDCETVAWDMAEKKVLPFQQLMTRKRKDVKTEDVKVKVCVFAFDLLFLNGEAVVEKSLRERRELLHDAFTPVEGEFSFATHMNGQELEEIQTFLDESVKASCEGLMVKMLDGSESGYEPSKRSRNWLKIKKDYLSGVGDSLDLVVLGAYHGKGKRTSVYGAFLLACYNPKTDTYETICNIGTGFSEQVLEELHKQLSEITIDRPKPFYSHTTGNQHQPDVWFEPRYVWEVKTADLTLSPRYKAGAKEGVDPSGEKGISLRFPRFIKIRDDKKADEATSSRQVAEMYRKQESVTKSKGPAADDDFEY